MTDILRYWPEDNDETDEPFHKTDDPAIVPTEGDKLLFNDLDQPQGAFVVTRRFHVITPSQDLTITDIYLEESND